MRDDDINGAARAVIGPAHGERPDDGLEAARSPSGVVVGVDDSLSVLGAVGWAAAEASRRDLPLHLLQVRPPTAQPSPYRAAVSRARARALLHRAAGAVAAVAPDVPVSTATATGNVGRALVSYAAHARLLVVGSRRLDGLVPRTGGVLAEVTAHARCPVVLVPPRWAGSWASTPSTRPVLVGVDPSSAGERALAFAAAAADRLGVSLVPIAGMDAAATGPASNAAHVPGSAGRERPGRGSVVQWLVDHQQRYPELTVEPLIVAGKPQQSLLELGHRAQLMVLGSRGRGAVANAGLGSTDQTILRHSPCAVVVLSPATARSRPPMGTRESPRASTRRGTSGRGPDFVAAGCGGRTQIGRLATSVRGRRSDRDVGSDASKEWSMWMIQHRHG